MEGRDYRELGGLLGSLGVGEPSQKPCAFQLEGLESMGLFELGNWDLVKPRLFVSVGALKDSGARLEKERSGVGVEGYGVERS